MIYQDYFSCGLGLFSHLNVKLKVGFKPAIGTQHNVILYFIFASNFHGESNRCECDDCCCTL